MVVTDKSWARVAAPTRKSSRLGGRRATAWFGKLLRDRRRAARGDTRRQATSRRGGRGHGAAIPLFAARAKGRRQATRPGQPYQDRARDDRRQSLAGADP